MPRPIPLRTWAGLVVIVISEAATIPDRTVGDVEHAYLLDRHILLADGIVWRIRGNSWLSHSRAEFLFLCFASVPLWVIFELYNKYSIHNWHYLGLPEFDTGALLRLRLVVRDDLARDLRDR